MQIVESDRLVSDYLSRLQAAAWQLPVARRDELIAEVREHIDDALGPGDGRTEVATRNVLERLGPPEEIVRAETDEMPVAPPAPLPVPSPWGPLEVAAVALIALGGFFLPVIGQVVGLVLLWVSSGWTTGQKALGTVLALLPLIGIVLLLIQPA